MKRRIAVIFVCLCMALMLLPQAAFAAGGVEYLYCDENGANWQTGEKQAGEYTVVTDSDTEWTTGWYVINTDVTINSRVNVSGDVHLILVNGSKLIVNDGIKLENENRLTIYGQSGDTGKLIARDGEESGHAAIGGNINGGSGGHNGGILTINGGTVKATSAGSGAAIGGSSNYMGGGGNGGIVTINGGIVTATSTGYGAGIGGGFPTGSGGIITINGGEVTATSTAGGAGIGGGGDSGHGDMTIITGGKVTATSTDGAGIGGGDRGAPSGGTAGNVIITGGTVKATSTNGSDIGSGKGVDDRSGTLLIIGGSVDADDNVREGIKPDADNSNNLEVFGDVKLPVDLTIPAGKTLTIPSGTSLTIPEEKTLTIPENAALTNSGKIYVDGTFTGTADNTYYPLTLEKAAAAGDTSEYNDKTYGKTGSDIALTPDTPSTGQEFKQWVVSGADVTITDNAFTMPSAAITVSAQFGPIAYTIYYEGLEGAKDTETLPKTHTYGTATAIPNLTRTGYTFQGWMVNDEAAPVKDLTLGATDYTATITLTPVWTVNQYNITYEGMEGAEYGEHHPATHTYDAATTISNPTKIGHTFQGWKVNGGETPVKNLTLGATDYTAAITLTPVWTANRYNISYEGMEGAEYGEYHPAIHTYDTATTISNPTRIGHTFQGWKVNGGETPVKDLTLDGKGYTDDITLTAVWTVDTYTVTLNLNGGTVNSGNVAEYTYGVGAVLPTQVTRINCFFMGWYDNEALTGDPVTAIGTDETGVREYWARWIYVPSQSGWKELEPGSSYYQNGLKVKGLQEIDGKTYYFDEKGYLQTGWVELDGGWYYFADDMQTGWQKLDGCWYFLDPDTGVMAESSWVLSKGVWYYLGGNGAMLENQWVQWNGVWYYLGEGGAMLQSRWLQWNGAWYYLDSNGTMLANRWLQWNGAWYYLGTDGVMLTNTVTPDGYKVDASGVWVK